MKSKSNRDFYNAECGILIKFKGAEGDFVIVGDETKVSDQILLDLFVGKTVEGWDEQTETEEPSPELGPDDSHHCPSCDKPNQLGEVCPQCCREIDDEDHLFDVPTLEERTAATWGN